MAKKEVTAVEPEPEVVAEPATEPVAEPEPEPEVVPEEAVAVEPEPEAAVALEPERQRVKFCLATDDIHDAWVTAGPNDGGQVDVELRDGRQFRGVRKSTHEVNMHHAMQTATWRELREGE